MVAADAVAADILAGNRNGCSLTEVEESGERDGNVVVEQRGVRIDNRRAVKNQVLHKWSQPADLGGHNDTVKPRGIASIVVVGEALRWCAEIRQAKVGGGGNAQLARRCHRLIVPPSSAGGVHTATNRPQVWRAQYRNGGPVLFHELPKPHRISRAEEVLTAYAVAAKYAVDAARRVVDGNAREGVVENVPVASSSTSAFACWAESISRIRASTLNRIACETVIVGSS